MGVLYAKSAANGGTTLLDHSLNVAWVADKMAKSLGLSDKLRKLVIVSSILHDIGKCDESFQKYITSPQEKDEADWDGFYHTLSGWAYLHYHHLYIDGVNIENWYDPLFSSGGYAVVTPIIQNAILYHHVLVETKKGDLSELTANKVYAKFSDNSVNVDNTTSFMGDITKLVEDNFGFTLSSHYSPNNNTNNKIPSYYSCESVAYPEQPWRGYNDILTLCKFITISADRYASISERSGLTLDEVLEVNIQSTNRISFLDTPTFDGFNHSRFNEQVAKATDASSHRTSIIQAPAGYGKTILGLLWASQLEHKRVYWVCPFNSIAEATYKSIVNDLKLFGLSAIKVGLLLGNKFIEGDAGCDITITNIDNWLRPSFKSDKAHASYELLNGHVVFDEYHEYVCEAPFFYGFINFMQARHRHCPQSKTLLLSATPPPKIEGYWHSLSKNSELTNIIECSSMYGDINTYSINFVDGPSKVPYSENMVMMFNSIAVAQDYYVNNNPNFKHLIHSRYTDSDKKSRRDFVWDTHNKNALKANTVAVSVVATRIIGTGFDISFKSVGESILSPQHTLQLVGRSNRFNEFKDEEVALYFFKPTNENGAIGILYNHSLSKKWHDFLKQKDGRVIKLNEFYTMYKEFHTIHEQEVATYVSKLLTISFSKWKDIGLTKYYFNPNVGKININSETISNIRSTARSTYYICRVNNQPKVFIEEPLTSDYTLDRDGNGLKVGYNFLAPDYERMGDSGDKIRVDYLDYIEATGKWVEYFGRGVTKKRLEKELRKHLQDRLLRASLNKETPFIALSKSYNSTIGCYEIKVDKDMSKYYQFI